MAHSEVQPHERTAFAAWGGFLRAHAALATGLDDALRDGADLSLSAYDLLAQVVGSPDRRIRMHDLEQRVLVSQSTVSRLAARLEQAGLLARCAAVGDRRAVEVRLTAAGATRFAAARRVAVAHLREHFVGRLRPGQDAALLDILTALTEP